MQSKMGNPEKPATYNVGHTRRRQTKQKLNTMRWIPLYANKHKQCKQTIQQTTKVMRKVFF